MLSVLYEGATVPIRVPAVSSEVNHKNEGCSMVFTLKIGTPTCKDLIVTVLKLEKDHLMTC